MSNYTFSNGIAPMTGSATRNIFSLLTRPEIISFAGGNPARDCLPTKEIGECTAEVFADDATAKRCLQYGATEGIPELREEIIRLAKDTGIVANGDGSPIAHNNVQILSGGSQGLDLLLKAFCNPGDVVLVEDPTFLGFLATVQSYAAKAIGVKMEDDGFDLADLEDKIKKHQPKLLYVISAFSNPTGKTHSAAKRKAAAELAGRYGVVVAEDDPYGKLRYSGTAVPAMKSFDTADCVVYLSSFSKTISPGMRCGFAIGQADIIRKMAIGKQGTDLHTSNLSMMAIAKYLQKGYFYPNIEKSIPIYRQRKDAMVAALQKYMPEEFQFNNPEGGLFIWGEFIGKGSKINTAEVFPKAIERNVAYIQGSVFYADGSGPNTLRLNFSNESPERIDQGIKALGELFKEEL
ncbi:MAG: PLP-dependent aminotransferase family protein [Spirochaetaceae bacterium]|jgi:2-aminoadipate transaminase|nr:PLP-dependent aminotransferase family protein [Spirochaetaceae bacterium]